jgi:hypothetical protein
MTNNDTPATPNPGATAFEQEARELLAEGGLRALLNASRVRLEHCAELVCPVTSPSS